MNMQGTPATKRTGEMDVIDRFDTATDTLPNGEERCDCQYKDIDDYGIEYGYVSWARCTRPATMHILVTPADTLISTDGLANVTCTPRPDGVYEAKSCRECYESALRTQGTWLYPAKVEALPAPDVGSD